MQWRNMQLLETEQNRRDKETSRASCVWGIQEIRKILKKGTGKY